MIGDILLLLAGAALCAALISTQTEFEEYFPKIIILSFMLFLIAIPTTILEHEAEEKVKAQKCLDSGGKVVRYSDSGFICVGDGK